MIDEKELEFTLMHITDALKGIAKMIYYDEVNERTSCTGETFGQVTHSLNSANKHISGLIVKEPPASNLNPRIYKRDYDDSPF